MSYKIAVASSDGKVVNQHFGRATKFLIFEIEAGEFKFLELLDAKPFCNHGEHDDNKLSNAVDALKGCRAVLVSQIGNGAAQALSSKGIAVFDIHTFIDDALRKLINYYDKNETKRVLPSKDA
jgi:predicted Fe-Mo cluster-binding NifX family protein